ncbi:hypothetical protein Hanom_Chr11g01040021 [Helianthus anomalus]
MVTQLTKYLNKLDNFEMTLIPLNFYFYNLKNIAKIPQFSSHLIHLQTDLVFPATSLSSIQSQKTPLKILHSVY